jgi:hypothetical protein
MSANEAMHRMSGTGVYFPVGRLWVPLIGDLGGWPESNAISSDYVKLMRTKLRSLILTAGSSLLLAGCCTADHFTKWEYKVAAPPTTTAGGQAWAEERQSFLNDLGKDGWVLVYETGGGVYYLKRPIR